MGWRSQLPSLCACSWVRGEISANISPRNLNSEPEQRESESALAVSPVPLTALCAGCGLGDLHTRAQEIQGYICFYMSSGRWQPILSELHFCWGDNSSSAELLLEWPCKASEGLCSLEGSFGWNSPRMKFPKALLCSPFNEQRRPRTNPSWGDGCNREMTIPKFCTVVLHKRSIQKSLVYVWEMFAPALKNLWLFKYWLSIILDLGMNFVLSKIPFKLLCLTTDVHLYK